MSAFRLLLLIGAMLIATVAYEWEGLDRVIVAHVRAVPQEPHGLLDDLAYVERGHRARPAARTDGGEHLEAVGRIANGNRPRDCVRFDGIGKLEAILERRGGRVVISAPVEQIVLDAVAHEVIGVTEMPCTTMEVTTTEPGVQLYTGAHFNGPGKQGARYPQFAGFAAETQRCD